MHGSWKIVEVIVCEEKDRLKVNDREGREEERVESVNKPYFARILVMRRASITRVQLSNTGTPFQCRLRNDRIPADASLGRLGDEYAESCADPKLLTVVGGGGGRAVRASGRLGTRVAAKDGADIGSIRSAARAAGRH